MAAKAKSDANGNAIRVNQKHGRGQSAATVYAALRREILELEIEPGTLLDETDLANRFSLSRSPVREALIRLSAEGLVKTLRNRSSIVAPFDVAALPSFLDAVTLLYRLTARQAANSRTPNQLAKIKQLQIDHGQAAHGGDVLQAISLNEAFHLAIAEATGNSFFVTWMKQLLDHGQRVLRLYFHSLGDHLSDNVLEDHLEIVRAIEARDGDAAEAAARRDAEIISQQMTAWFASRPSDQIAI
ncbi:MAG: GntR family transcriptional regulator [Sphingorhabdus sp.]